MYSYFPFTMWNVKIMYVKKKHENKWFLVFDRKWPNLYNENGIKWILMWIIFVWLHSKTSRGQLAIIFIKIVINCTLNCDTMGVIDKNILTQSCSHSVPEPWLGFNLIAGYRHWRKHIDTIMLAYISIPHLGALCYFSDWDNINSTYNE